MEEMKMMLEKVKDERDGHRELLKMSNQKNHELREKVNRVEQEKHVIYTPLQNMRQIASDHLEDNNSTPTRYVDLDIQHSSLRTEHEQISTQLSDLKEVYGSVSKELGFAIRTNGQLETQAKEYRKQIEEASKTLAEHANLKAQYQQISMEYENIRGELDMARDEVKRHANRKASNALVKMGLRAAGEVKQSI
jgi:chromosome segregation ATPase